MSHFLERKENIVSGIVLQKKSDLEGIAEVKKLNLEIKKIKINKCKFKTRMLHMHKDGRILNTREDRIYDRISKRKYISSLTKKTEEKIKEVRMFVVQRRDA